MGDLRRECDCMYCSLLSLSLGRYFVGSFVISAFLGAGLFFAYRAISGLHYGNENWKKYAIASIVFVMLYSMILIGLILGI